jgi:hypothetical protein
MEALPIDLVLLIVDCITLKSDLKALCQTSKTYRKLVLPRLYYRIQLILWDDAQKQLRQFARCIAVGAGAHLRYTRCLIIEDTKPPAGPRIQCSHGSIDTRDNVPSVEIPEGWKEMVDAFILLILEMFPEIVFKCSGKSELPSTPFMSKYRCKDSSQIDPSQCESCYFSANSRRI